MTLDVSSDFNQLIIDLQNEDQFVRASAAQLLGDCGNMNAVEPLLTALTDRSSIVRCNAAEALGKLRDPEALDGLIQLLRHTDWNSRLAAVKALGILADPRAIEPLVDVTIRVGLIEIEHIGEVMHSLRRLGASRTDIERVSAFVSTKQRQSKTRQTGRSLVRDGAANVIIALIVSGISYWIATIEARTRAWRAGAAVGSAEYTIFVSPIVIGAGVFIAGQLMRRYELKWLPPLIIFVIGGVVGFLAGQELFHYLWYYVLFRQSDPSVPMLVAALASAALVGFGSVLSVRLTSALISRLRQSQKSRF